MESYENEYIQDIDKHLNRVSIKPIEKLRREIISRYGKRSVSFGRKIFLQVDDLVVTLHVLFLPGAETRPPLIALESLKKYLIWPHVERDGVLCLLSEHDATLVNNQLEVLSFLIDEALQLITKCLIGNNREDFESEANTYWGHNDGGDFKDIFCLLDPETCTNSFIYFWAGHNSLVFGDDPEKLKNWVKNFLAHDGDIHIAQTIHLRLDRALIPSEYPRTGSALFQLITLNNLDLASNLENVLPENIEHFPALISAPTTQGQFIGAVVAEKQRQARKSSTSKVANGFRKGKVPQHVIRRSIFNKRKTILKTVHLVTRSWIHGRYHDPMVENLGDKTVVIIGCGSLGSFVTSTLAMSGISNIVLIDKDVLHAANISRHVLGSKHLLKSKALSLEHYIKQSLPHIESVTGIDKSIESLSIDELGMLFNSNLIISLMGDTSSELYLNKLLHKSELAPPVIYGWMEAFASAHHALYIQPKGACFKCGLDDYGKPIFHATSTSGEITLPTEPACGTSFMPYGSISVQNAASLVSEFALDILTNQDISGNHRIRIESTNTLKKNHIQKSEKWIRSVSDSKVTSLERMWDMNSSCDIDHE